MSYRHANIHFIPLNEIVKRVQTIIIHFRDKLFNLSDFPFPPGGIWIDYHDNISYACLNSSLHGKDHYLSRSNVWKIFLHPSYAYMSHALILEVVQRFFVSIATSYLPVHCLQLSHILQNGWRKYDFVLRIIVYRDC